MARKKKRGALVYTLLLTVYTLALVVAAGYGLTLVWNYAEAYEKARPDNTMNAYMDNLRRNLWNDSVEQTIESMPHEVQSTEECKEIVKVMLSDELSYTRLPGGANGETEVSYDLLCGGKRFGKVSLIRDPSVKAKKSSINIPLLGDVLSEQAAWIVEHEEFDFNGLYSTVKVTVPETYGVSLNGVKLGEEYIVERDIPSDVMKDYYDQYPNLPRKVTYQYDNAFGELTPVVLDESGKEAVIDASKDDSQYIQPVDEAILGRLTEFAIPFADAYLAYSAGVSDPMYAYSKVAPFIELGGDLDLRLKQAMDGMGNWGHTTSYRFDSGSLNRATDVGEGLYILEISAVTTTTFPNHGVDGVVTDNNGLTVIVHDTAGEIRAVAVTRYDADEA